MEESGQKSGSISEVENISDSVSMLSEMTKLCVSQYKNAPEMTKLCVSQYKDAPEPDLRSLKDLVAVVNTLNPLVMQHFGQGAAELTLRYEDLEIEKESI